MLHSMAADLEHTQHLCNVLKQLALLPLTSPPNPSAISTMVNKLSIKLQSLLTKASKMLFAEASLLDYIKGEFITVTAQELLLYSCKLSTLCKHYKTLVLDIHFCFRGVQHK